MLKEAWGWRGMARAVPSQACCAHLRGWVGVGAREAGPACSVSACVGRVLWRPRAETSVGAPSGQNGPKPPH